MRANNERKHPGGTEGVSIYKLGRQDNIFNYLLPNDCPYKLGPIRFERTSMCIGVHNRNT